MRVRPEPGDARSILCVLVFAFILFFVLFAILIPLLLVATTTKSTISCDQVANKLSPQCINSTIQECFEVVFCVPAFCDGLIRDYYNGPPNTLDVGACHAGVEQCVNMTVDIVVPEVVPAPEVCDNATLDRNCNGFAGCADITCFLEPACINSTIDNCFDVYDCDAPECEGLSRQCYTGSNGTLGIGVCTAGNETCSGGVRSGCEGEVVDSPEDCFLPDLNCNGLPYDGFPLMNQPCSVGEIGTVCQVNGTYVCNASGYETICDAVPNPLCENVTVDTCIASSCFSPMCANMSRVCNGTCREGLEGCDEFNVPYNCTAPSGLLPPIGGFCSIGTGFCQANGTYQCAPDGDSIECDVPISPSEFALVNVITTNETALSQWQFDIDANFTLCNASVAELYSYVVRFGVFGFGGEEAIFYANVNVEDVVVTGDCTLNPDFFNYNPPSGGFPEDSHTLYPAEPVAFLNAPVTMGSCHVTILANSPYFTNFGSYYSAGRAAGCVYEAANTTKRTHEVAIVVNGDTVAQGSTEFTRCPADIRHSGSINQDTPSPFRLLLTQQWTVRDASTHMGFVMDIRDFFPSPLVSCSVDSTNGGLCSIDLVTGNYVLGYSPPSPGYGGLISYVPFRCRARISCLFPSAPGDIINGNSRSFIINERIPRVGPYYNSPEYGEPAFAGNQFGYYENDVPEAMIIQQSVTNNFSYISSVFSADPNCDDGIQNQDETDIDCGGSICWVCDSGESCLVDSDCLSLSCSGLVCD